MSPQSNPQPSPAATSPQSSLTQQEQQELISLRREKAALSAMLWELVRQAAPETHDVEVLASASDPLWQLAFVQSSDQKSGKVRILAGTIKPIAEQEKKRVVRLLRGTTKPMHEALAELKLAFPPSYVEKAIELHLKWSTEAKAWESVAPAPLVEIVKNAMGLPKS